MNYYQHHIGDFNNATRHLTRVERALYRDLIELYYDTEKPLVNDITWLERKVIARTEEEIEALLVVLQEFFTLEDDGYHNRRCDADIEKYHSNSKAKSRAGKASAAKRKQKATPVERVKDKCATNQEPITNNQEPKDLVEKKILDILNSKAGKKFKPVETNLKFIRARLKEGHSEQDIIAVIDRKIAEWLLDPTMKQYLRPATLFNAEKFNQYIGELGQALPANEKAKPAWQQIPRDDNKLWDWAKEHNFPGPGSRTYPQYRSMLQIEVERRMGAQ